MTPGPRLSIAVLRGLARALDLANSDMDADPDRWTVKQHGEVATAGRWVQHHLGRRAARRPEFTRADIALLLRLQQAGAEGIALADCSWGEVRKTVPRLRNKGLLREQSRSLYANEQTEAALRRLGLLPTTEESR